MGSLFHIVNDDIGITILSLLPQKTLLKFRSVNKSWRHTIDSPILRELHVQNQLYSNTLGFSQPDHGLICNRSYDDDKAFLQLIPGDSWKLSLRLQDSQNSCDDFPSYQDFFRGCGLLGFSGPVHGLICLYRIHSNSPIALCNPSLGKIKILPPTAVSVSNRFRTLGFGYDDVKKDYKVVQMRFDIYELHTVVEVYSRKKNTWRVLADHPVHRNLMITGQIRRLQPWMRADVVHWYGFKWSTRDDFQNHKFDFVIISFDMRTEALDVITVRFIHLSSNFCAVAREHSILLFSTFIHPTIESTGVHIWEYKKDWSIVGRSIRPLVMSCMSDGLVFKIVDDNKLVLYDYWTKQEIKCFYLDVLFKDKEEEHQRMIEYMGSFISP